MKKQAKSPEVLFLLLLFFCFGLGEVVNAQKNVQLQVGNSTLGIENPKKSDNSWFAVSPNPNKGTFIIKIKNEKTPEKEELKIYNSTGVLIFSKEFKPTGLQFDEIINVDNLPAGIYLFHLFDGVKLYNDKLIINK